MQAGRRPWLWGLIGTASVLAIFFLVILLITVLLTGGEGITDGGAKIGVIAIESTVITSGPFKDSGSPMRALRPEERQVFQALVDDVYQQFVEAVAQGRNLPVGEVRQAADGRIYTGRQAKELRLVDELGSFQDAITYTAT